MEFSEYRAEIKTVDAQESYNGGVLVLVTGYLTGKDNIKRNFTQTFFLAPQEKGYFVLNDMFRYVEAADEQQEGNQSSDNSPGTPLSHEQDSLQPQEQQITEQTTAPLEEEEEVNVEEVYNPSDNEEGSVVDEEAPTSEVVDEVPNSSQVVADSSPAAAQEEAPKKSYASIVKVMRESSASLSVPAMPVRPTPANPERQAAPVPTSSSPTPEAPASGSHAPESVNVQEAEVDGCSIYIKSLPLNATPAQLEEEFKRFGPIKPGGIQVRSHKQQGFCFGFVEFEVQGAVQSAIEASPIMIGGRPAYVEEKRPSGSRGKLMTILNFPRGVYHGMRPCLISLTL
uniref:Putative G3BP-like protein n=1 Tax=Anthurium amnicola TaxID=1678845 RepID=A0A1D1XZ86_9ARAE